MGNLKEIKITETAENFWVVEMGEKFIDRLCLDEANSLCNSLILCGKALYGGMHTYENAVKRDLGGGVNFHRFVNPSEIRALIPERLP